MFSCFYGSKENPLKFIPKCPLFGETDDDAERCLRRLDLGIGVPGVRSWPQFPSFGMTSLIPRLNIFQIGLLLHPRRTLLGETSLAWMETRPFLQETQGVPSGDEETLLEETIPVIRGDDSIQRNSVYLSF